MGDCENLWSGDPNGGDHSSSSGGLICFFRIIFDIALLCISAVFLLQHDPHTSRLVTLLAQCIAATSAASLCLSIVECFVWASPFNNPPVPALLHFTLACGRLAIAIVGLVPKNSLKEIWVQYKRDKNGGVIIALIAVLWVTDALYSIYAGGFLMTFITSPCWGPWKCCVTVPLGRLKRRARSNREVVDRDDDSSTASAARLLRPTSPTTLRTSD